MARLATLSVLLFAFWLLLSGHYKPWLLAVGLVVSVLVALLARRMDLADEEGHPVQLAFSALTYWPWLIVEIYKSAFDVARRIVAPKLAISPTLVRVQASQKTAAGVTTYANSITLTPGTITTYVSPDNEILVHALTEEAAGALGDGEMDRRVTEFEGAR